MLNINKLINAGETQTEFLNGQNANLSFDIQQNGVLNLYCLLMGQTLDVCVNLIGQNAAVNIKTLYLSATDMDNDIHFEINHLAGQTYSHQLIKGVACGISKSHFYGIIRIPANMQKCEGSQTHKALLLSENAVVNAVPELEIYADDVKCAHGSSVGALDEKELFYLSSRGIDAKTAKKMLIKAFALSDMPNDFEQPILQWMADYE